MNKLSRKEVASLGGKARALKVVPRLKKETIEKYYKNPNICKYCGKIIEIKDGQRATDVRIKKFCNQYCASKFNNKDKKIITRCLVCGKQIGNKSKHCNKHKKKTQKSFIEIWNNVTKKELSIKRLDYQSRRSTIQRHARKVFKQSGKPMVCVNCGYDKFVDVSHLKSVSSFDNEATFSEINNINNLIALCPNCHWEFDHKILKL